MRRGTVTHIKVDYDCDRRCSYTVPTTIPGRGSALRHASAVDTVVAFIDAQHDESCPAQYGTAPPPPPPASGPAPNDGRLVLTVGEAAKRLGVGRTVMYELISSGDVESILIGRLRRVPLEALADYVQRQRNTP